MDAVGADLKFFESMRKRWLKEGKKGRFSLIHDRELIGWFSSHEAALDRGYDLYGSGPFTIHPLLENEQLETRPAYALGLLSGGS